MLAAYLLQPALWHKHYLRYSNLVMHWIVLGERLPKPTPCSPSRSSSSAASTPAPSTSSCSSRGCRARCSSGAPTGKHGESTLRRLPHVVGSRPKRRRGWGRRRLSCAMPCCILIRGIRGMMRTRCTWHCRSFQRGAITRGSR